MDGYISAIETENNKMVRRDGMGCGRERGRMREDIRVMSWYVGSGCWGNIKQQKQKTFIDQIIQNCKFAHCSRVQDSNPAIHPTTTNESNNQ